MSDRCSDSFNDRAERSKADFDNLQHTLSGVEVGQQTRHGLTKVTGGGVSGGDESDSAEEFLRRTLEWLLLNDPVYKQAHENLMTSIRGAQQATQTALERVQAALAHERSVMDELLSTAARLPDGTKVFKDKNGHVRDEDGEVVSPELAATIEWSGDEPSYEMYLAQRQRIGDLETAENELRGVETGIGDIHERANNNEKPLTPDQIETETGRVNGLLERIEEIETSIKVTTSHRMTREETASFESTTNGVSELSAIPDLSSGGKL